MKKTILIIVFSSLFISCSRDDKFYIVNGTGKKIKIIYELIDNWKNLRGYFDDTPYIENITINGEDFEFKSFDEDSTLIKSNGNIFSCDLPINTCLAFGGGSDFSKFNRDENEQDFQTLKRLIIIRENNDTTIISAKTLADIVIEHEAYDIKLILD